MNILLIGCKEASNSSKVVLDLIPPTYHVDKLYIEEYSKSLNQIEEQYGHKEYDTIFILINALHEEHEIIKIKGKWFFDYMKKNCYVDGTIEEENKRFAGEELEEYKECIKKMEEKSNLIFIEIPKLSGSRAIELANLIAKYCKDRIKGK